MKNNKILLFTFALLLSSCLLASCSGLKLTEDQQQELTEKTQEIKESVSESADKLTDAAAEQISKTMDTASDVAKEKLSEAADAASEVAKEKLSEATDIVAQAAKEQISEAVDKATENAKERISVTTTPQATTESSDQSLLSSPADISLTDEDGKGRNYVFSYNGETFRAQYTDDNWKIYNSYKITSEPDIIIICQALIDAHQIHGSDMTSFRTAEDMAYEWIQHNIAYAFLAEGNAFKAKAKDVDFNPEDQGKSFEELYKDRTGKELTMEELLKYLGGS